MSDFDKYDEPRLHMERLMKAHLLDFDINLRTLILLEKSGIRTLGDLVSHTKDEILAIPQLGKLSITRLENLLTYHKLSFKK